MRGRATPLRMMSANPIAAVRVWIVVVLLFATLAGCAGAPRPAPYRAETLIPSLAGGCDAPVGPDAGAQASDTIAAQLLPSGISLVRSDGHDIILVAAGACVFAADPVGPALSRLRTGKEPIEPTAVDAGTGFLLVVSATAGTVRWIDAKTGATVYSMSGLQHPLGARLLPGGAALLTEYYGGRVMEQRPISESRPVLLAEGLAGPVGVTFSDALTGYVTEMSTGQVTRIALKNGERKVIVTGLKLPQGIAALPDGRLVVAEVGLRRLVAVQPATGRLEVLADNLPIGVTAPGGETRPDHFTDVVAGRDGAIYLSSDVDRSILLLRPRHR